MNHCPESTLVQDYLDDELTRDERERFEAHAAGCAAGSRELAAYGRVYASLADLPVWAPSRSLADRVIARVLPHHEPRWVRAVGWAYGTGVAASLATLAAILFVPGPRSAAHGVVFAAARSLVASIVFVLNAINDGLLRVADGLHLFGSALWRLAPLARALTTSLSQPAVVATVWAALAVCALVLWWMRSREHRTQRGIRHVAVLGF
jgi:anti-sigma factor RsiW